MKKLYTSKEEKNAARRHRRAIRSTTRFKEQWIERIPITGCWLWTGQIDRGGYGRIRTGPANDVKAEGAHRYMYRLYKGDIPDGMDVCHQCDVRCCVNPNHLFIGTRKDNIQDMWSKGRGPNFKGELNPNYRHGGYVRELQGTAGICGYA